MKGSPTTSERTSSVTSRRGCQAGWAILRAWTRARDSTVVTVTVGLARGQQVGTQWTGAGVCPEHVCVSPAADSTPATEGSSLRVAGSM